MVYKMTKEQIQKKILGKLNAHNGIHPIEHLDGMGNNRNTQWYYGPAMRSPRQEPIVRSLSHTKTVTKEQLSALHEIKHALLKSPREKADIAPELEKVTTAINTINAAKKDEPLTEYQLLCILRTSDFRKKHTSKYEKNLLKKMGRKRAKKKMLLYSMN